MTSILTKNLPAIHKLGRNGERKGKGRAEEKRMEEEEEGEEEIKYKMVGIDDT